MQKPNGYDEVRIPGDFTPVELGGHHMIVKGVREEKSKSGKDMIVVAFDFAQNDKQPGYFADLFEKDIRPEKKWPNNGTQYIVTMDGEKVSRSFKSFITSVERSNDFEVKWDNKFCDQFKGKKVGGVFGLVEEEYNGEVKQRHKLRWFCEDSKVDGQNIPQPKYLTQQKPVSAAAVPTDASGFIAVPEGIDEEIPF